MLYLIGYKGSIGLRYHAILKSLDIPHVGIDLGDDLDLRHCTRAIIATPTETHFEFAKLCEERKIPYLLEKPATKDMDQARQMAKFEHGFIVNNYWFLQLNYWWPMKVDEIEWDFFKSGRDGLHWDCIQLIYMAKKLGAKLMLKNESPIWEMYINDTRVPYECIEQSYIDMIRGFVSGNNLKLLPITHALGMAQSVVEFR